MSNPVKKEFTLAQEIVKKIIEEHPEARDSYEELYFWYIVQRFKLKESSYIRSTIKAMFSEFRFETLSRARRKVQEKYPELLGKKAQERRNRSIDVGRFMNEDNSEVK